MLYIGDYYGAFYIGVNLWLPHQLQICISMFRMKNICQTYLVIMQASSEAAVPFRNEPWYFGKIDRRTAEEKLAAYLDRVTIAHGE